MFRVPLVLEKSVAVIHRLSPHATKDVRPYTGATSGYDKDFRETVVFDDLDDKRETARVELPPVRVPCQVEVNNSEKLDQKAQGNTPTFLYRLVLWRGDLETIKLIDKRTREMALKVNDRVSHIEAYNRPGTVTVAFPDPGLFIVEIQPASFGFGPDGFDLHIVFLEERLLAA